MPNAPRDVKALLEQYRNLINSLYQQESTRFTYKTESGRVGDKIKQDDLRSYIIYQFIILVKEYDPHSGVDFPYYIKEKLTLRTRHSYIKKVFRDEYREVSDDATSDSVLANSALNNEMHLAYDDNILDGLSESNLDDIIIDAWLLGVTTNRDVINLVQEAMDLDSIEIQQEVNSLKEKVRTKANAMHLVEQPIKSNYTALVARSKQK